MGLLIILLLHNLLAITTVGSVPVFNYNYCFNTKTFKPNSTFQTNLKQLLSALSSNATSNINGFHTSSAGGGSPDAAYGLFMCRGDLSGDICSECVSNGTRGILDKCPFVTSAVIWYEQCLVRYSDENTFGVALTNPWWLIYNTANISDPNRLAEFFSSNMTDMTKQAANDESGKKFVTREVSYGPYQTIYSMVQCTPNLPANECESCLFQGIEMYPRDKSGGSMLNPSCRLRFDLYPFYDAIASPPPPPLPAPPPPPPLIPSEGKSVGYQRKGMSYKMTIVMVSSMVVLAIFLLAMGICVLLIRRERKKPEAADDENVVSDEFSAADSLEYDFRVLEAATNNFSDRNKLGEGGFGSVYKGKLPSGREVAIKRLSKGSSQGITEFKTEVVLVRKLQHKNLVRLLGFCLAGDEKLLVYEFVPNKSLDCLLFDPGKKVRLDWPRRYKIIEGIARGMLYLHEESRLRIIHRDLKPSNVLLDSDLTPKIADFGMAKIFGVDDAHGKTIRIVGTYGYMAPEYVMRGEFSVKSDVYSFGVLVLEIISGQKIGDFHLSGYATDLFVYAWKKWREEAPLELMDPALRNSYSSVEVIRCIHIALLCVQKDVEARPSTSSIVILLSSDSASLPDPRRPAFFATSDKSTTSTKASSVNDCDVTEPEAR